MRDASTPDQITPDPDAATIPSTVRWEPAQHRAITELADTLDRSFSWIVRRAVDRYLADTGQKHPTIEWPDEPSSSGFGYACTVHFHLPAVSDADQAAYEIKDRLLRTVIDAGARHPWTDLHGTRGLEIDRRQASPDDSLVPGL